jgi:hypothetical protein
MAGCDALAYTGGRDVEPTGVGRQRDRSLNDEPNSDGLLGPRRAPGCGRPAHKPPRYPRHDTAQVALAGVGSAGYWTCP